jgi:hypothetical protein
MWGLLSSSGKRRQVQLMELVVVRCHSGKRGKFKGR